MKIFCDYVNHRSLINSLVELFENRLGYEIYFSQYNSGYPPGFLNPANDNLYPDKRISFEQFKNSSFDVLICTCTQNENIIYNLQQTYFPKAKVVRQLYNVHEVVCNNINNVLLGCDHDHLLSQKNILKYIPEHNHIFDGVGLNSNKEHDILIFKDYFHFIHEIEINSNLKQMTPKQVKHECIPNLLYSMLKYNKFDISLILNEYNILDYTNYIKNHKLYFHLKSNGGCGFTPREVLFGGLPLIVNSHYSKVKFTQSHKFFIDGENCIDVNPDIRDVNLSAQLITEWLKPDQYQQRQIHALEFTKKIINYQDEANKVKEWIENL